MARADPQPPSASLMTGTLRFSKGELAVRGWNLGVVAATQAEFAAEIRGDPVPR